MASYIVFRQIQLVNLYLNNFTENPILISDSLIVKTH